MNILEVISAQRNGKCLLEAQEKLQEAVKKAALTGKKASVTIKLNVVPLANDGEMVIKDDVSNKLPTPEKAPTTFYYTDDGALLRDDPKQREFPEVAKAVNA